MDYSRLPAVWSRIVIDGDPGAGKTTLAREMANVFSAKHVSFDEYLAGNRENYLVQLDYARLLTDISSTEGKIIIEGVCALKILAKVGVKYDFHIFLKRVNGFIGWDFEQYLNPNVRLPRSRLDSEVVRYYRDYKPFETCNFEMSRDILASD